MTELVEFNKAYQAIMAAKRVDEVKQIRDKAEALRLYLKQQGESLEMQNACAEIKTRAERRAGQMLKEMPKNGGGGNGSNQYQKSATPDIMSGVADSIPTLEDMGLTYKQSSRFQAVADIPEEVFEATIAQAKAKKQELTTKKLLDSANREKKKRKRKEKVKESKQLLEETKDTGIEAALANIHHGDFRQVCQEKIAESSIDVILTDPPYPEEFLPLYEALAQEAARILKPGGSLLVMCGQSYLPQIFALMTPHLKYHWTLSYQTPGGQAVQIWPKKAITFWKPILWFVKGEYQGDWHGDVIQSDPNDNDKRFDDWGQSESGFTRLVENFTSPGDLILDPFLGGGTTGAVAIANGRRFIGIDIDEQDIAISKARILKVLQESKNE